MNATDDTNNSTGAFFIKWTKIQSIANDEIWDRCDVLFYTRDRTTEIYSNDKARVVIDSMFGFPICWHTAANPLGWCVTGFRLDEYLYAENRAPVDNIYKAQFEIARAVIMDRLTPLIVMRFADDAVEFYAANVTPMN